MIKKILVSELVLGMYVEDTGLPWDQHPYLYNRAGLIADEAQLKRVFDSGYRDVFINTAKGLDAPGDPGRSAYAQMVDRERQTPPAGSSSNGESPLERELPEAKRLYQASLNYAKSFMADIRLGKGIDISASQGVVDGMLESVSRNGAALLTLAKLRGSDEYTFTHSINVSLLSLLFARQLGLPPEELRLLGLSGLFHDMGKALTPEAILNKPGKLTEAEFAVMKRHPVDGYRLMRKDGRLDERIALGAAGHHEKHAGGGYPRGITGEQISPFARIIAVADIYDALTSARVYKPGMLPNKAMQIVYELKETNFHPGYVERFIKCLGIYPLGSFVRLSGGEIGVVSGVNAETTLYPSVCVFFGPDGKKTAPKTLDLAAVHLERGEDAPKIQGCIDPKALGLDLSGFTAPGQA